MSQSNIHYCHHCDKPTNKTPSKTRSSGLSDKVFCDRKCYDLHRKKSWQESGFNCATCNVRVEKPQKSKGAKFCSMQCRKDKNLKECITDCIVCSTRFSAIKWHYDRPSEVGPRYTKDKTRKVCSTSCHYMFYRINEDRKRKIGDSERGDKHHNWQGGTHRMGGRGAGWLIIAEKARKRAGYKCEHCGKSQEDCGRKLDVNHKIPFHQHQNKTQANRLSNLEALCKSCHMLTEWKWRKENQVQLNLNIFDGH